MPITDPKFLLAEWSVTTPAYIRYNSRPYTDTPRHRWEAIRVAPYNKRKRVKSCQSI